MADEDNNVYVERTDQRGYVSGGGLVPVPDPTKLTTDQLRQEIKALRELLESRMSGSDLLFATLREDVNHQKNLIENSVEHLRQLLEEKIKNVGIESDKLRATTSEIFERINVQFIERD